MSNNKTLSNRLDIEVAVVAFYDVTSMNGWRSRDVIEDYLDDPGEHIACGIIVGESNHILVLSTGLAPGDDEYMGLMFIPKGCIIEIREVKSGKQRTETKQCST